MGYLHRYHRLLQQSPDWRSEEDDRKFATCPQLGSTNRLDRELTHFRRSQLHWLDVIDRVRFRVMRPGVQMSAQDGS